MEKSFIYLPFYFSGNSGYEEVRVFLKDGVHECIRPRQNEYYCLLTMCCRRSRRRSEL